MIELQCDHSDRGTWKKIVQSQHSQIFVANGPTIENFKLFELTRPLKKEHSNSWMLLVYLQKNLRIFCFQKTLWLDNLLPSDLFREVAL